MSKNIQSRLFSLCQDWKSFEEAIQVVYILQMDPSPASKLAMVNRLKKCFSPLAALIEEGLIEAYSLTPLQTTLALSLSTSFELHEKLAASKTEGKLPIEGDAFGRFCENDLFLYLRHQPTNSNALSTQEGVVHFCTEMNKMSPGDSWGDLIASNIAEYLNTGLMTQEQIAVADQYQAHRNCQLQVIQEVEETMKSIDPFWKNRLFIYKESLLQVKVMSELKPDSFQIWLEEQKLFDPEMYTLMSENITTFDSYCLTPNEQHRVWSAIISVGGRASLEETGFASAAGNDQLSHRQHRATRTLSAAVLPELSALSTSDNQHTEANGAAMVSALLKYQSYLDKPAIQIYEAQIGNVTKTLFGCFCSGLEPLLPGFNTWANEHSYLLLTVPLAAGSDEALLQQVVNALMAQSFEEAHQSYVSWLSTCAVDSLYAKWSGDIAFVIAKVSLDASISQYCQSAAMQLMPMDQPLFTQLSSQHPSTFVEIASLVACDQVDQMNLQTGMGYLMGMAQQQMQASGQQTTPEQLQMMIQQSQQQQCTQLQQGMSQQSTMVQQLAQVYLTNYPKASASALSSPLLPPSDSAAAAAPTLEIVASGTVNDVDDSNVFNPYAMHANLLISLLSVRNTLESVSSVIYQYYMRANKSEIAQLFTVENRVKLACFVSDDGIVSELKSIGSQIPDPTQTPRVASNIAQKLKAKTANLAAPSSPIDQLIAEKLSDPVFVLIQELLHALCLEAHSQAFQMCSSSASQDPTGALQKIADLLNTPQGINDFIGFNLTPQQRSMAVQVMSQESGLLEQFNAKVEETIKQSKSYIEMVTKDIVPVYYSQLSLTSVGGDSGSFDEDPFEPLYQGMFAPTGLVDQNKFQMFSQFCTFRRSVRNDPSLLPKVLQAIQSNPPFMQMAQLMNSNTEDFISGSMFPEEGNIGYASTKETKLLSWHEADLMKPPNPNQSLVDPLASCAKEITFLLVKRSIFENPVATTVQSCQQMLMSWGQAELAQLLPQHVNDMLRACGGKLTPMERARLNSYDEREQATVDFRRKLNQGKRKEEAQLVDRVRVASMVPGSGFNGLEMLMLLHHFSTDVSSLASNSMDTPSANGNNFNDSISIDTARVQQAMKTDVLPIYNRLMRRDPTSLKCIESFGTKMAESGFHLLTCELNRLKHAACLGLLRNYFSAVEKGQYGEPITATTEVVASAKSVMPPIDIDTLPYSVKVLCLEHIKFLQTVVDFVQVRDQYLSSNQVASTRKSSVFEKYYNGGHLGTSTQFLLWKLEFIGADTAEDCQQQIYVEEKLLGTLIFQNMTAFRDEPFQMQELSDVREILSKAIQNLYMAVEGPDASPFLPYLKDENFLREKVWAQQMRDKQLKDLHYRTPQKEADSIGNLVSARFRHDPKLAAMRNLVEKNMDKFLNETLTIKQQEVGWKQYLYIEFQAQLANGSVASSYEGQRPELALIILQQDMHKLREFLVRNVGADKYSLFSPYGAIGDQCYIMDALKVDTGIEMINLLVQNGYPVANQLITTQDEKQWHILHYMLLFWGEQLKESPTNQVLFDRLSAALELFVRCGIPLGLIENGVSPLYLAGCSGNSQAVKDIVRLFYEAGVSHESCLNTFLPTEQYSITVFHAVVMSGHDYAMVKLLKELGANIELPLTVVGGADFSIQQSTPPLHLALDQSHDPSMAKMAQELLSLGARVDSIKLLPWLKSEMIKKVGRMNYVGEDMEEENSLNLMKVDVLTSAAFSSPELFSLLIEKGADVNYIDPTSGFSPLHQVMFGPERSNNAADLNAGEDKAIVLAAILLDNGADVNAQTTTGNTALYLASQKKLVKMAQFLLERGADPNLGNKNKETPFHIACFLEDMKLIDMLVQAGGNGVIHHKDVRGNDGLLYSASFGKINAFNYLVSKGADLSTVNEEGRTIFLQSIVGGQKEFAQMLYQSNPSVLNDVDKEKCNALHCLAKMIAPDAEDMSCIIFMWLVNLGVNVLARDKHLCLPLHYVAASGNVPLALSLIWKMLDDMTFFDDTSAKRTSEGNSGLMSFASICGIGLDATQLEKLKGSGKTLVGSPLFFAAHNRREAMVSLFLKGIPRPHEMHPLVRVAVPQAGGTCNASGEDIPFPGYYMAAADGANFGINESIYQASLAAANQARINDKTDFKWNQATSIHLRLLEPVELTELLCYAVDVVDADLVELLISKGASVDTPDLNSKRPLQYASAAELQDKPESENGLATVEEDMGFQVRNPLEALSGAKDLDLNIAKERIRTLLVENGAQVFIVANDPNRGRYIREQVSGHTILHRMVWNKKPVQLLSESAQEYILSTDDDLGRLPCHHAAARGCISWLRVLREYKADIVALPDAENWLCLHEAAYGAQVDTIKLLLMWRKGQITNLYDEYVKRGIPTYVAQYSAYAVVYSLESETLYGETCLELAYRGKKELLSVTSLGKIRVRIEDWSIFGMLVGSFIGLVIGDMINSEKGPSVGFGLGLLFGLLGTWGMVVGIAAREYFTEKLRLWKQKQNQTPLTVEKAKREQEASFERELKLKQYDRVIQVLKTNGANQFFKRWLYVKFWRNTSFVIFAVYCGLLLPFCQLRDLIGGKLLSEAFLKLKTFGNGDVSILTSMSALAIYLFFIIVPFIIVTSTHDYGVSIAAVYVIMLFVWVLFILYRALSEDRLWAPVKRKSETVRNNASNVSVFFVLFFEWQQLSSIGFFPQISWPISVNIQAWYNFFSLNLNSLGKSLGIEDFLLVPELNLPNLSNNTKLDVEFAAQYYDAASSLSDLSNAGSFTFWINFVYVIIWFFIIGYLSASCVVRNSKDLQKKYPFIRSDFYGQLPGAHLVMPLLASGFFLSILTSLLGVMACAYAPSAADVASGDDDQYDDEEIVLMKLNENECFHHDHKKSVMLSLIGLLFYMPSAFLVGISFLNDEKNENLDVRFLIAYEVIVNFIKVAVGLLVLFSGHSPTPLFIFMIIFLVCLGYATYNIKPCREVKEVNILRTAFHASAIFCTICAAIAYGIGDDENDTPVILFFIGNLVIFGIFLLSYFSIPSFFMSPMKTEDTTSLLTHTFDDATGAAIELSNNIQTAASSSAGTGRLAKRRVSSIIMKLRDQGAGDAFEQQVVDAKNEAIHEAEAFLEGYVFDAVSNAFDLIG